MSQPFAESRHGAGLLVLGVDTCGPSGSMALAQGSGGAVKVLAQRELAGRSYSATLVAAVADLLAEHKVEVAAIGAIVVVNGPGSFTGVRVGLSAVKGLAEPGQIPVVAVSRLRVLAAKTGLDAAALDAHRHEVFVRLTAPGGEAQELLAGAEELAGMGSPPAKIAVCDDAAGELVQAAWQQAELVRTEAPTAADAIALCVAQIVARDFADLALLDGHYLRRSDAEIFGDPISGRVTQVAGKVSEQ